VGVDAVFIDAITQKAGSGSVGPGFNDAMAHVDLVIAQSAGPLSS
jgi:hypothetical protein